MRIKFKEPDPRAGMVAQMDSNRGQHFVDTGAAVKLKEDGSEDAVVSAAPAPGNKVAAAPKNKAKSK